MAVSGGVDSMVLLHLFLGIAQKRGVRLYALHYEHGIRGPQSEADLAFVQETCRAWGVPLLFERGDVPRAAAEDKAKKDEADARNAGDQAVYQAEKTIADLGDKVTAEEKAPVESAINDLKEKLKGTDVEAIKASTEALTQAFYKISEKLYQQQPQDGAAQGAGAQGGSDDNVVDADYEVVDDDK